MEITSEKFAFYTDRHFMYDYFVELDKSGTGYLDEKEIEFALTPFLDCQNFCIG